MKPRRLSRGARAGLLALIALGARAAAAQPLPEIRAQAPAVYPPALNGTGIAGSVSVIVEVNELGRVVEAAAGQPGGPLDRAAEAAARALWFTPARRDGQRTPFSAIVVYDLAEGAPAAAQLHSVFFPETVSVTDGAPDPAPAVGPVSVAVAAEEARRVPGTQGDAARVVESLPGVARAGLGTGDLVLWGSAPAESRVYVDGIEVPALFHLGGLRSVVATPFVADVDLIPGAHGATVGRGLGGLVLVTTPDVPVGVHGGAALDLLDASAHLSAGSTRWRMAAGWREGLVHHLLADRLTGDAARLVAVPRMRDQQLKASALLSDREEVQALFLAASDSLERSAPSADPADERRDTQRSSFWRAGLRYLHLASEGRSGELLVWVGGEHRDRDLRFGTTPARLGATARSSGARASYREQLGPRLALTVGLDALVARWQLDRAGSLTIPAREGDPGVFGQPPGGDVNADRWRALALDVAPLASTELSLGRLTLHAGARLTALGLEVSRMTPRVGDTPAVGAARLDWAVDPRLSARLALTDRLAITAAAGRYHQLPAPEDLSAVFGTPTLGPSRAEQAAVAARLRLTGSLTVEACGFGKRLADLPARHPAPTPPLAGVLTALGRGRTIGAQLLVRAAPWRGLSGWLAYTASRSDRRDGPQAAYRPADFDQPQLLALVLGYQRGAWNAGGRLRAGSGVPRTPVFGAYYDAGTGRFTPLFGPVNAARLPAFVQLDVRAERTFPLPGASVDLYLELLNVTAHRNAEERVYSHDYLRSDVVTGLPFLAVAGARVRF